MKSTQFIVGLTILVSAFGLLLFATLSLALAPELLNEAQIRARAEETVPQSTLPSRPAGKTVTEIVQREIITKVPEIRGLNIRLREVRQTISEPVEKFIKPSDADERSYNEAVTRISEARAKAVQAEADKISRQQREELRSLIKDFAQVLSSLFGVVIGLINVIMAVRKDRREMEKEAEPTADNLHKEKLAT